MKRERKDMEDGLCKSAAVVKLICGVANNAAWLVALDGYDHAKKCKRYRQTVKKAFREAVEEWHRYERNLLHAEENRMFHVADMSADIRKKYGDITDREYYDFWSNAGAPAYEKTKPLITSLWNKYKKSLESHDVQDAEHVAWVMTALASLELSVKMFERAVEECISGYNLPRSLVRYVFGGFSLQRVSRAWRRALVLLEPGTDGIDLSESERRNIELGLEQLCEAWVQPSLLYDSTFENVGDYEEVFRTKGEQKKCLREIAEVREATEKELSN